MEIRSSISKTAHLAHHNSPTHNIRTLHPLNHKTQNVESLTGLIERVTYFNEENGYAVLKIKAKGNRDLVTVVGSLPSVSAGEWVTAQGVWVQDREFGLQFKAEMLTSTPPTTVEGIEKYLGSGMVKGIGPVYAKKLVGKFGDGIFDVIEQRSADLETVDGIGPKRRQKIKAAWAEQKVIRKIMVFLHSHGVSTSRSVRIYKTYGEGAVEKVQADPYSLARDIHGIGFKTADQIAQKVGVPHDSVLRAAAGLSHVLLEATNNGNCALPLEQMLEEAGKLLLVGEDIVKAALAKSLTEGKLVQEKIGDLELVFLPVLKRAEENIAARLRNLAAQPPNYPPVDFDKAVAWCQQKTGKVLAPSQREALKQALTNRVLVITGGPGGKNYPRQRHSENPVRKKSEVPALCPHWPGCQTHERGHRFRCQHDSPAAGSPTRRAIWAERSQSAGMRNIGGRRNQHD